MRFSSLIFLAICLLAFARHGAQTVAHIRVNFAANSSALDSGGQDRIDSMLAALPANKNFEALVTGHSDNLGSAAANQKMSLKRALQCKAYLLSKGFSADAVATSGRGFSDPLYDNDTEQGRAGNRRAEITFREKQFIPSSIAGIVLDTKRYKVDAAAGGLFFYPSGSSLEIPANAFVDANGKAVTGNVQLVYEEYRDPIDLMLAGIPMTIDRDGEEYQFNSAGMFKLLAFKDGKPVKLREDRPVRIRFARTQDLPGQQFFRFDTIGRRWNDQPDSDCASGAGMAQPQQPFDAWRFYHYDCRRMGYDNYLFATDYGLELANSNQSLYQAILRIDTVGLLRAVEKLDSLNHIIDSVAKIKVAAVKRLKAVTHKYNVSVFESNRSSIHFKIFCRSGRNNELSKLSNVTTWKYKIKNEPQLLQNLSKNTWTLCEISAEGENYSFVLENNARRIELHDVELQLTAEVPKAERQEYLRERFNEVSLKKEKYLSELQVAIDRLESLNQRLEGLSEFAAPLSESRQEYAWLYQKIQESQLWCFWTNNWRNMTEFERKLRFERWLIYFDEPRGDMLQRYSSQKASARYRSMTVRPSPGPGTVRPKYKPQYGDTLDRLMQTLCVNVLGYYNCDVFYRLQMDDMILVKFKNKAGNIIHPQIAYLYDKRVNTIVSFRDILYDRSMTIRYNADVQARVVIIDKSQQTYLCSTNAFITAAKSELKGVCTVEAFLLKPVRDRKQLKKILDY